MSNGNQQVQTQAITVQRQPSELQKRADQGDPDAIAKVWINRSQAAFQKILPKHVTLERFVRVSHAMVTKSPDLAKCAQTHEGAASIIMGLIHCSELGLEPNTPLGHAYLIPFGGLAQFIPGYKGYIHLARQTGEISAIGTELVCEHDRTTPYRPMERPPMQHEIFLGKPRGKILGAYCFARYLASDQDMDVVYMSIEDIETIRQNAPSARARMSPWKSERKTDYGEMCKKTTVRRWAKTAGLSPEKGGDRIGRAAEIDNRADRNVRTPVDVEILNDLPQDIADSIAKANEAAAKEAAEAEALEAQAQTATATQTDRLREQAGLAPKQGGNVTAAKPDVPKDEATMLRAQLEETQKRLAEAEAKSASAPTEAKTEAKSTGRGRGKPAAEKPEQQKLAPATEHHDAEPPPPATREPGED